MKCVVTGGAGFIGCHLVDRLLEDGYTVTVVDNLSCGKLENLRRHSELDFKKIDITNGREIDNLLKHGYDAVFHLAAHANIRKSLEDHRVDLDNNVIGTLNILEAMMKNSVGDFVFASSSAVYGEATVKPTSENYSPTQTSLYGASKLACEAFAEAYTEFSPIRVWAYRFSNVVGERCSRGVVGDFVRKLLKNPKELEILGNGKQSKEYLHVKDCVNGILTGYHKSSNKTNVFNLGMENQTIVDEVADIVIAEMGLRNVKRRYTGGEKGWIGDNPVVELSLEKIKSLGWKTEVSSEEALRRTTKWNIENEMKNRK